MDHVRPSRLGRAQLAHILAFFGFIRWNQQTVVLPVAPPAAGRRCEEQDRETRVRPASLEIWLRRRRCSRDTTTTTTGDRARPRSNAARLAAKPWRTCCRPDHSLTPRASARTSQRPLRRQNSSFVALADLCGVPHCEAEADSSFEDDDAGVAVRSLLVRGRRIVYARHRCGVIARVWLRSPLVRRSEPRSPNAISSGSRVAGEPWTTGDRAW